MEEKARSEHYRQQAEVWYAVQRAIALSEVDGFYSYGVWADEVVYVCRKVDRLGHVPINAHHIGTARRGAFKLPGCSKD